MKSLGFVIGECGFTAALVDPGTGDVQALRGTLAELDTLADAYRQAGARVAAILDTALYHRRLSFPFVQPRKIRQVLPLQLDEHLPGPAEAFERQLFIGEQDGEGVADVLLLPAETTRMIREALLAAGILPRTLEPLGLVLAGQAPEGCAQAFLGERRTTLGWREDAQTRPCAKTIPLGAVHLDEASARANLAVRVVAALPQGTRTLRLIGTAAAIEAVRPQLAVRGIAVEALEQPEPDVWLASLAARELVGRRRPVWNLAPRRPLISPELAKSGVLQQVGVPVAALLVMIAATVITGNHALLAEARAASNEIREIYRRNFPDSRIVDPLRQMQAIVERAGSAQDEAGHVPVLQSLLTLHRALPDDVQFQIDELRSGDGNWLLRGLADDYGTVDRIKAAAEAVEAFRNVRVQRAEQTLDKSHVRFTLSWEDAG